MFSNFTLAVVFDCAKAGHVSLALGHDWVRYTIVCGAPPPDVEDQLRRSLDVCRGLLQLADLRRAISVLTPHVSVSGPDAPDAEAAARLRAFISDTWRVIDQTLTTSLQPPLPLAASPPPPPPPPLAAAAASLPPPLTARATPHAAPFTSPSAPGRVPTFLQPQPSAEVKAMAATIRAYISQHGSAPDFRSEIPGVQVRARNYIRSTLAKPNAPDELIEQVRVALQG